jgi:pimeloyl-ACP methyl ester carboxylesterase
MNRSMFNRAMINGQGSGIKKGSPWTLIGWSLCGLILSFGCTSQDSPEKSEETVMEQITSHDGTVISYKRSGSGPPLILVHGTTASHKRWESITPRFEPFFTVIAMDRRGRGESGDGPDYNLQREAEDIAALADALEEPSAVFGHSYGGLCSLEAALLTDNISKLILYEAPLPSDEPLYPPGVPERMQEEIERGELEAALEIMIREVVKMPDEEFEMYRKLPMWQERIQIAPTIPREMEIELSYTFDPDRLSEVTIPVMLLTGGDSPPFFQKTTQMLHDVLPDSRIVSMPGQQHIAMDTDPDLFVREMMAFLNR